MAHVLEGFEAWMAAQGIEHSEAIELVAAAQGCSGLALGVQVRALGRRKFTHTGCLRA